MKISETIRLFTDLDTGKLSFKMITMRYNKDKRDLLSIPVRDSRAYN